MKDNKGKSGGEKKFTVVSWDGVKNYIIKWKAANFFAFHLWSFILSPCVKID
jgi:hypothetical protein